MKDGNYRNDKIKAVFSVILVFVVFLVAVWGFSTTTIYLLQREFLYWNYFSHMLMIALSVGAIALSKKSFISQGFVIKSWRSDFSIAIICVVSAVAYIPSLISPTIASNAALNSAFSIGATLLTLLFVSKKGSGNEKDKSSMRESQFMALVPIILMTTIVSSVNYSLVASTAIFQFFFAGFGEEIMFRGYMQNRLNEGFGRPWEFAGVKFGPGLLITSVLFGVMHLLNPFNPLQGECALAIWSGIDTTVGGFLFGFVKEKTGNVLAPSLAHGLVDIGQVVPLLL